MITSCENKFVLRPTDFRYVGDLTVVNKNALVFVTLGVAFRTKDMNLVQVSL